MPQEVRHHVFANGLTLLVEKMTYVRTAAFNFLVPAGCAYDPPEHAGLASVLSDLLPRGAGSRDSRALALAMDNLGLDRDESVGVMHARVWGATLARNLPAALELYSNVLRQPHLPDAELPAVQALALQDLQSLEDEPRHKAMAELRKHHFPSPLGRDRRGTIAGIESLTSARLRRFFEDQFGPQGAILAIAGNVEWQPTLDCVERLFGDWSAQPPPRFEMGAATGKRGHVQKDTHQTQIAIAYDSVPVGHPDYYQALGAVNVLSGGMSARLFSEVREKHGLCYAIYATYQTFKERGAVICYAGANNEQAQETYDRTVAELQRLADGIEPDEVQRLKAGLKSSLIMQEESTSSRAGSLASDWYYLGRVRSFDEIQSAVQSLTPNSIVEHVRRFPPRDFTVVTLGPQPLDVPLEVP